MMKNKNTHKITQHVWTSISDPMWDTVEGAVDNATQKILGAGNKDRMLIIDAFDEIENIDDQIFGLTEASFEERISAN